DFARWPAPRQAATAISWLAPALSAELPARARAAAAGGDSPVSELTLDADETVRMRCRLSTPASAGSLLGLDSQVRRATLERAEPPRDAVPGEQLSLAFAHEGTFVVARRGRAGREREDDEGGGGAGEARLPPMLSYTSLGELERCGYRYYLERVLGLPEDRAAGARAVRDRHDRSGEGHGGENHGGQRHGGEGHGGHGHGGENHGGDGLGARARGLVVHRLLESRDFSSAHAVEEREVRETAAELGVRLGRGQGERLARLVSGALAGAPAARLARAERIEREHPFAFALAPDEPLITGVIDVLARESDGGSLVLDYKSDRVAADVELARLVGGEYALQRELYALAVLREGAPAVEILHWFLERPAEWVSRSYLADARDELEERLRARLREVRARGFAVSAAPHRGLCLTCPGRSDLCSWSERETLRENPLANRFAEPVR
ncbi:MAG TPA: PD-(D/E)XK nuclease family protein, partial [Solirubrobacteraceae bacterium]|nr:PD-(D/E)XK nuclease family protein [Solirubrobacteraceae bacterium]